MPRRSSYTGEDGPYAAGGGSSQGPAYRRLSQYVPFQFSFASVYHIFSMLLSFPPSPFLHTPLTYPHPTFLFE
jgi:hypothetical protein